MKPNRWSRSLYLACCWLMILASFGSAQNSPTRADVNVPFDFYVSGDKLPAGPYTLEIVAPTYVTLRSADGKLQRTLYFVQTGLADKDAQPTMRFAARKGQYYLAEVWSSRGKGQLTSFNPQAGDEIKEVPLNAVSPDRADPSSAR